jgi:putative restriction endonuclease
MPRLGQGTFRVAVMEAYERACAATGEHSLPALEAAHIMPFVQGGPHDVRNGLLLRADLHRLLDQGYMTVTDDLRLEVSPRLRDHYHNGHTYYPLHGKRLRPPPAVAERPAREFVRWHHDHVFLVH